MAHGTWILNPGSGNFKHLPFLQEDSEKKMNRTKLTLLMLILVCGVSLALAQDAPPERNQLPNFVIIMADDLGYGDISPFDGWIRTPHLDQMAREGMRFTNFYASGPVCSPTRAGLLTGRYQQRAGIPGVIYAPPDRNRHHGLQTTEYTFAEAFRAAGYATGVFGKWHLGYERQFNPVHHGFDKFQGYVSGNVDYFSHVDGAGFYDWWSQDELVNEPGYVTHLITQHAVSFIEQNQDNPFVLYLPHEAPHYPFQGPDDEPFRIVHKHVPEQRDSVQVMRAYREMVEEMDAGVGAVLNTLNRLGLDENTMVLFFSDNGATQYGSNGSLRGFKGSLWEGGIRVPAIFRWKGKIVAGSTSEQEAITLDIFPTLLEVAGMAGNGSHFDGVDLSPAIFRQESLPERRLYWSYGDQSAMRMGPWKLRQPVDSTGAAGLFNLREDLSEMEDISNLHPEPLATMIDLLNGWKEGVAEGATRQPERTDE